MSIDVSPDIVGDGRRDAAGDPAADRTDAVMCLSPRPACVAQSTAELCDPYCQSGCGCTQRCSVNSAGAVTCNEPRPGNLGIGQSCDVISGGTASQVDACAPGLVCVRQTCGMHCFAYCRSDADCPQSACSRSLPNGTNPVVHRVCEVSYATCDPLNPADSGCALAQQTCYLSPVSPDKTFCECPAGDKREAEACANVQDCLAGLTCVDATDTGDLRCRAACRLNQPGTCGGGAQCQPIKGSKTYGICL